MDPLTDLIAGPRAHAAFTLRAVLEPPWGIQVTDRSALTVVAVLRGEAGLVHDEHLTPLGTGDVLLVQGTSPYRLTDRHGSQPRVRILPGQQCVDLRGRPVHESMNHGLRTWGNDPAGRDVLFIGAYASVGEVGRLLTAALPACLVVRYADTPSAALRLMATEMGRDAPGQGTLLDRLLDVLLIDTVRAHVAQARHDRPSWLSATDPVVVDALGHLHADVSRPWTLESLARAVGTSRASLSRKFVAEVGLPPIGYLTRWRLARAADLLADPQVTVAAAARSVGYGTPFALSTAFKRQYGVSPRDYRARAG